MTPVLAGEGGVDLELSATTAAALPGVDLELLPTPAAWSCDCLAGVGVRQARSDIRVDRFGVRGGSVAASSPAMDRLLLPRRPRLVRGRDFCALAGSGLVAAERRLAALVASAGVAFSTGTRWAGRPSSADERF